MTTNTNNTMSTSNQTTAISFRNKFKALLTEDNYEAVASAFQQFCDSFTPENAINYLWNMTYLQEDIRLEDDDLFWCFPQGNIIALRNELRSQYGFRHPGFLGIKVPEGCQEALDNLRKRTDDITTLVVCEKCKRHTYLDESSIKRTLHLLSSDLENLVFGGIRSLGFYAEEASYLSTFHMEIHDLLKALYDAKREEDASHRSSPFAELVSMVEQEGEKQEEDKNSDEHASPKPAVSMPNPTPETSKEEKKEQVKHSEEVDSKHEEEGRHSKGIEVIISRDSGFKAITTAHILQQEACFKELLAIDLSSLRTLRDRGFDLNEVIDKVDKIRALLMAANDLNETA